MKKTMLTYKTLDRFEAENDVLSLYTAEQIKTIEFAAYVANMNTCAHPDWTDDDVYRDFLRVLKIHKIPVEISAEEAPEEPEERVIWRVEKLSNEFKPYASRTCETRDEAEKVYKAYLAQEMGNRRYVRMYGIIDIGKGVCW